MDVPKQVFKLHEVCADYQHPRYALDGVRLTRDADGNPTAYAITNTHMVVVSWTDSVAPPTADHVFECWINARDCRTIVRSAPRQMARISVPESAEPVPAESKIEPVHVFNDLSVSLQRGAKMPCPGCLIARESAATDTVTVVVDADLLVKLLRTVIAVVPPARGELAAVKLVVSPDDKHAVRIVRQIDDMRCYALLAPMKKDSDEYWTPNLCCVDR